MEHEDLLYNPIMSEIFLEHRERGRRIVRRRREENIAQRKHWGSFATDKSRRALRYHIQLTEDLAIRKWIHMHQYWDIEGRIERQVYLAVLKLGAERDLIPASERDGVAELEEPGEEDGVRDITYAHEGEEWGGEADAAETGDWLYQNSKWLYFHFLRAVDDEKEAGRIANEGREAEVLRLNSEKWDSWIDALRDEYSDFEAVSDWVDPEGYEFTRESLDEDIELEDRYSSELAWARGGIFGPYGDGGPYM